MADQDKKTAGKTQKFNLPTDEHGNVIPGPGRPKGAVNKVTAAMQDMVSGTMDIRGEELQDDIRNRIKRRKGKTATPAEQRLLDLPPAMCYLVHMSRDHPQQFAPLVAKLMPAKIDIDVVLQADALMEKVNERRTQLRDLRSEVLEGVAVEVEED